MQLVVRRWSLVDVHNGSSIAAFGRDVDGGLLTAQWLYAASIVANLRASAVLQNPGQLCTMLVMVGVDQRSL